MDQPPQIIAQWKHQAAMHAVSYLANEMIVGLGSGSTATAAIQAIAARMHTGLRITAVSTSSRSSQLARQLGIPLVDLDTITKVDITIDGADEVNPTDFTLIKGLGGALLREKLVALASETEIIIADEHKLVRTLGERSPVPVEVEPFAWRQTQTRLEQLGCHAILRPATEDTRSASPPFLTDSGHYILDCHFGLIPDPARLASAIKALSGVVEHGLFIGLTHRLIIAGRDGIRIWDHPGDPTHHLPAPRARGEGTAR